MGDEVVAAGAAVEKVVHTYPLIRVNIWFSLFSLVRRYLCTFNCVPGFTILDYACICVYKGYKIRTLWLQRHIITYIGTLFVFRFAIKVIAI